MKIRALFTLFVSFLMMSVFNYAANPPADETTIKNIKAAITGETTASAKYSAYAKKAKDEALKVYEEFLKEVKILS